MICSIHQVIMITVADYDCEYFNQTMCHYDDFTVHAVIMPKMQS